jgi:hypothetical protein
MSHTGFERFASVSVRKLFLFASCLELKMEASEYIHNAAENERAIKGQVPLMNKTSCIDGH